MQEIEVAEAPIDRCPACGGVWLDWFDGEVTSLARAVEPASVGGAGLGTAPTGACPRCGSSLGAERFRGTGPEVRRCAGCQGLFLTAAVLPQLAAVQAEYESSSTGPLARLVAALRRLVGSS